MSEERKQTRRSLEENIENLVGDVKEVVRVAVIRGSDVAGSVGENIRETINETIQGARIVRNSVVMVRVEKETLARLDELVESGLSSSRSEAAAFLIREGIKSRQSLFDKIAVKIEDIRKAKEELRLLIEDDDVQPQAFSEESAPT